MDKSRTKRLRIFAGPNGSGKSTLATNFPKKIPLGVFVNADIIESEFHKNNMLSLAIYNISSNNAALHKYLHKNGFSSKILSVDHIHKNFSIKKNSIYYNGEFNSYIAADIAGFIRNQLLINGESFSFETVFSHKSKLDFIIKAKELGYRVYFYFLTTEDPAININRVNIRVALKGHAVPKEKIRKRYYRSLELMFDAIKLSTRAYLFDNSSKYYELVAQVNYGKNVEVYTQRTPNWFRKYLFNKISNK